MTLQEFKDEKEKARQAIEKIIKDLHDKEPDLRINQVIVDYTEKGPGGNVRVAIYSYL